MSEITRDRWLSAFAAGPVCYVNVQDLVRSIDCFKPGDLDVVCQREIILTGLLAIALKSQTKIFCSPNVRTGNFIRAIEELPEMQKPGPLPENLVQVPL
jgi:hypothetical protein